MTAQIIELSACRAAHPDKAVRVRLVYDCLLYTSINRGVTHCGLAAGGALTASPGGARHESRF